MTCCKNALASQDIIPFNLLRDCGSMHGVPSPLRLPWTILASNSQVTLTRNISSQPSRNTTKSQSIGKESCLSASSSSGTTSSAHLTHTFQTTFQKPSISFNTPLLPHRSTHRPKQNLSNTARTFKRKRRTPQLLCPQNASNKYKI